MFHNLIIELPAKTWKSLVLHPWSYIMQSDMSALITLSVMLVSVTLGWVCVHTTHHTHTHTSTSFKVGWTYLLVRDENERRMCID